MKIDMTKDLFVENIELTSSTKKDCSWVGLDSSLIVECRYGNEVVKIPL